VASLVGVGAPCDGYMQSMGGLVSAVTRRLVAGGVAGLLATLVMSAFMEWARRSGWLREHPPEEITERALQQAGASVSVSVKDTTATAAHLAFGVGAGAAYGLLPASRHRRLRAVAGVGYGLGIWAVSYAGWAPALRLMPSPTEDRSESQAAIVASHVVYGAVLGATFRR
jgi:Family of unknown function (DUF6789)